VARKVSSRVVYNRQTADALDLGLADGLLAIGEAVISVADVPDATPFGQGLVTSGDAVAYINGRKIGGSATKPRSARSQGGVEAYFGFGFPGRFQELGTIHQPPRPFLTPALNRVIPGAAGYIKPKVKARVGF
jgi:hypothetical protein